MSNLLNPHYDGAINSYIKKCLSQEVELAVKSTASNIVDLILQGRGLSSIILINAICHEYHLELPNAKS